METKEWYCKQCKAQVDDPETAIATGCIKCGSRFFTFQKVEAAAPTLAPPAKDDGVAIHVVARGRYEINLQALASNEQGITPLIVKDQQGKFNILLNPQD